MRQPLIPPATANALAGGINAGGAVLEFHPIERPPPTVAATIK